MKQLKYKRVLIKLSGEVLGGEQSGPFDSNILSLFAQKVKELQDAGVQVGMVIGGGNFWRYRDFKSMDLQRTTSDTVGVLATVMNALVFEEYLKNIGADVRAMSSFECPGALENYTIKKANNHLDKGRVVIFAGGTGHPFFTTDSAAALRALETGCDLLLKATMVDFVYDKDPNKFTDAKKYDEISYEKIIEDKLGVMDLTCAALCGENNLPMMVFNVNKPENLLRAVSGEKIGTIIS